MVEGRCMKCQAQVVMKNPHQEKTSTGRDIVKGNCPKCNTPVCRMGKM
jgi:DNA-directed RNA polymerase subunit RPC12/RpoP